MLIHCDNEHCLHQNIRVCTCQQGEPHHCKDPVLEHLSESQECFPGLLSILKGLNREEVELIKGSLGLLSTSLSESLKRISESFDIKSAHYIAKLRTLHKDKATKLVQTIEAFQCIKRNLTLVSTFRAVPLTAQSIVLSELKTLKEQGQTLALSSFSRILKLYSIQAPSCPPGPNHFMSVHITNSEISVLTRTQALQHSNPAIFNDRMSCLSLNDLKLLLTGGVHSAHRNKGKNNTYILDIALCEVTELSKMKYPRYNHAMTWVDSLPIVSGGFLSNEGVQSQLKSVEAFKQGKWVEIQPHCQPKAGHSACYTDTAYVFGGFSVKLKLVTETAIERFTGSEWEVLGIKLKNK